MLHSLILKVTKFQLPPLKRLSEHRGHILVAIIPPTPNFPILNRVENAPKLITKSTQDMPKVEKTSTLPPPPPPPNFPILNRVENALKLITKSTQDMPKVEKSPLCFMHKALGFITRSAQGTNRAEKTPICFTGH